MWKYVLNHITTVPSSTDIFSPIVVSSEQYLARKGHGGYKRIVSFRHASKYYNIIDHSFSEKSNLLWNLGWIHKNNHSIFQFRKRFFFGPLDIGLGRFPKDGSLKHLSFRKGRSKLSPTHHFKNLAHFIPKKLQSWCRCFMPS